MSVLEVPIILKLVPELAGILLSPEEFDAVEECDELYNYELVHGVLVVDITRNIIPRGPSSISPYPSTSSARPIADAVLTASSGPDSGGSPTHTRTSPPLLSSLCR